MSAAEQRGATIGERLLEARRRLSVQPDTLNPLNAALDRQWFESAFADVHASVRSFLEAAVAETADAQKAVLVSSLKEVSSHTLTIDELSDSIRRSKRPVLPACLFICAFANQRWPTSDPAQAQQGLQDLVQAYETIFKSMLLESFAERQSEQKYLLTLAAQIFVVDADVQIDQDDTGQWSPSLSVRMSYATDAAAGSGGNHVAAKRNAKLVDVLQSDMQAIARNVFGFAASQSQTIEHLAQLEHTVHFLRHLDDLSSRVRIPDFVDLFAVMEDFSRRLSSGGPRQANVVESQRRPYATLSLDDTQTIYFGIEESGTEKVQGTAQDGEVLPVSGPDGKQTHFVAYLDPPMAIPKSKVIKLIAAAGMRGVNHGSAKDDEELTIAHFPFASLEHLLKAVDVLRSDTITTETNKRKADEAGIE